jgi:polysaccharide biosynthesis transport protein
VPPPPAPSGPSASDRRNESVTLQLNQERERVRILKSQIGLADKELANRRTEQERILKELSSLQDRLGRMPIRDQDMAQLLRDYETSKTNYRMLLDKKISAEMSTEMERRQKSERFTVIDPARMPLKPVSPNRPVLYAAGCLAGLLIGIAMAALLGLRKDLFLGEWELPAGVAVLGRLPVVEIAPATNREVKKRRFGFAS